MSSAAEMLMLAEVFRLHDADAARQRAIRFLRQRGRYCLDQKVHRIGSPAWDRERRRQMRPPEVPRFLLRA